MIVLNEMDEPSEGAIRTLPGIVATTEGVDDNGTFDNVKLITRSFPLIVPCIDASAGWNRSC